MAAAPTGVPRSRFRRVAGIVLMVAGSLWTLLWAAVWYAVWALSGPEGVGFLALDWRFFAPTALGLAVLALGIGLTESQRRRDAGQRVSRLWLTIAALVGALAVVGGAEWALSVRDEGPFPFRDVPKGGLIAYSAPDGIRLVRATGGRSWLVSGSRSMSGPEWAPDGKRLAGVDLEDCCKAYSFAVDGSARARLPANGDTTPVWSPDGRRLAVVDGDNPAIRVVRLEDGAVEAVLPIGGNEPAWSPDGKLIAFQGSGSGGLLQIYAVRPDGSGLRPLTPDRETGSDTDVGASSSAWAPDGRSLAFASDLDGDDDIYVIRSDGTGMRKVTHNGVDDSSPTWSPDGRRVAFDRTDYERDRTAILVLDLATGTETEIAHSDGEFVFAPSWQPRA